MPTLLDSSEVAGMLGITERHVRRLVLERRIPFVKVGKFVRFDPRDIEQWVRAAKVPTVTPQRHHGARPTRGDET
jgi:excisionase family DNA binding protein